MDENGCLPLSARFQLVGKERDRSSARRKEVARGRWRLRDLAKLVWVPGKVPGSAEVIECDLGTMEEAQSCN